MIVALSMLLAMQAAPPKLGVTDPLDCTVTPDAIGCPGRAQARYRLPDDGDPGFDRKADALRQDGRQCGLLGQPLCTRKPRTILSTTPRALK
jgi:hypothetical protein